LNNNFQYLSKHIIDHAAQIISIPPSKSSSSSYSGGVFQEFAQQMERWKESGLIQPFPNQSLYRITSSPKGTVSVTAIDDKNNDDKSSPPLYYFAPKGMSSIATSIVKESNTRFDLQQDVWVSPSNGVRYQKNTNTWRLQANGKQLGIFDDIIIAHNGKCADRIMSKTPAHNVHELLRVNFSPSVPNYGGKKMTLNSIYSLTVAVDQKKSPTTTNTKIPTLLIGAFVQNEPSLRYLTCQSRKFATPQDDDSVEIWTILSSPTFAKKHKAPQEFLSQETIDTVSSLLLEAVERSLELEPHSLQSAVIEKRLQLWGAANPLNVWDSPSSLWSKNKGKEQESCGFIYNEEFGVGVCGDWLVDPSIGGAWTSGRRLAKHLRSSPISSNDNAKQTVGIEGGAFRKVMSVDKAGIGSLPLQQNQKQQQKNQRQRKPNSSNTNYKKNRPAHRRPAAAAAAGAKEEKTTSSVKVSSS
jgi:predicted NAD/FAD-dependent oxidoreductase